jgi:hypothetical protein
MRCCGGKVADVISDVGFGEAAETGWTETTLGEAEDADYFRNVALLEVW